MQVELFRFKSLTLDIAIVLVMFAIILINTYGYCCFAFVVRHTPHVDKAFNNPKESLVVSAGERGFLIYYDKLKAAFRL